MLRVLVVDDSPQITTALEGILRAWGHDVRTANGGLTAVSLAALFRPEVVLLDVSMPGITGVEAARQLRAVLGAQALLVAMTGLDESLFRHLDGDAAFDLLLLKPIRFDELERVLVDWIAHLAAASHTRPIRAS